MPISAEEDQHNSLCQVCRKGGDLLCCDTCTLVYHTKCLTPPLKAIPKGKWHCPICVSEMKSRKRKKLSSPSTSKVKLRVHKTTMTEVEAFPKEQYIHLFKLLKHFHQDNHISLSSLKQLKDLLVVADLHSMSILLSAHDLYESSDKKIYDILFCIDTFERVYLLNFPEGFVDLEALERVKKQKRMKQHNQNNNSNSNIAVSNADKNIAKDNGNVSQTTTSVTNISSSSVSKPKTHVLLQNLTNNKVKNINVINVGNIGTKKHIIQQHEKALGTKNVAINYNVQELL